MNTSTHASKSNPIKFAPPEKLNADRGDIKRIAETVRSHFNFDKPANLQDLTRMLGGTINRKNFWISDNIHLDAIVVRQPKDFTIYISETSSRYVNNFTIAHELGHYFLHYLRGNLESRNTEAGPQLKPMVATRSGNDEIEKQANIFAWELLVPDSLIENHRPRSIEECVIVAEKLDVEPYFVREKAIELGFMSEVDK
ncbi:MAG: ImmA/IrrE family metallo-endopeptidase [Ahrensia sp.]|nr:ImmA/IrrE family metallo-endopeptidase [Ahrensia sp.]